MVHLIMDTMAFKKSRRPKIQRRKTKKGTKKFCSCWLWFWF